MAIPFPPQKEDITLPGVLYALGDPILLNITRRISGSDELNCAQTYPFPVK